MDGKTISAFQESADNFVILQGEDKISEGKKLGGWINTESGISVSLRHLWQMYPAQLKVDKEQISIQMVPDRGIHLGFREQDIMPPH
ncbi:MAG: hypothetical protein ACYTFY_21395, partial [Planctomycetota bacterium]